MIPTTEIQLILLGNQQQLQLYQQGILVRAYPVSTAKNGFGEQKHSEKTPRGRHYIRAKIGHGMGANTVFSQRRPTGEMYSPALGRQYPGRDWILSRILWLSGLEPGQNRLGSVDTMQRYIYIHGCPDTIAFDHPSSHGCIRMRNRDLMGLFDRVPVGTQIDIQG